VSDRAVFPMRDTNVEVTEGVVHEQSVNNEYGVGINPHRMGVNP